MLFILLFDFLLVVGFIVIGLSVLLLAYRKLTPETKWVWIAFRLLGLALFASGLLIAQAVFHVLR